MSMFEGARIMIVEDETAIRDGIAEFLSLEGFEILAEDSGIAAIRCIQEFDPDLVITDILMPVMNGYMLINEYRKMDGVRDIPFIFLSALSERFYLRNALRHGAADFITKPFKNSELLDAILVQLKNYQHKRFKLEDEIERVVQSRLTYVQKEKESILREMHHRVKHNLAIISAFFDLGDTPKGEVCIESLRNRVFTLSAIHEEAYSNETLTKVSVLRFISNILDKPLLDAKVTITHDINDYDLDISQAIPFGLLFFELLKLINESHLINGKSHRPYIIIRSFKSSDRASLELITSNLKPIPKTFLTSESENKLMHAYLSQLKGTLNYRVIPERGVRYTIDFITLNHET